MMAVITNSFACSVHAFFSAKFHRDIEEMLVTPMPFAVMIAGFMVAGMVRGILVGFLVTLVALLFTHLAIHSLASIIVVALLSSAIFSLAGILNAVFAKGFDTTSIIPTFVLTPLIYLGGVFYSISLLPPVWRYISMVDPIVYIIHSFRYAILGTESTEIYLSFCVMFVVMIGFFMLAWWLVKKGVGIRQ